MSQIRFRTTRAARRGILPAAVVVAVTLLLLTTTQQGVSAGKPAAPPVKCSDIPLEVDIVAGGALTGDSKGHIYQDGVDGVYNTAIHICGTYPSYDATMGLITSKRSIGLSFPQPLPGSNYEADPPAWWDGSSTILVKPFMNVNKLLWGRLHGQLTFTTRMAFSLWKGPGDKSDYRLQYMKESTDAVTAALADAEVNYPSWSSSVQVVDEPGTCRANPLYGTLDRWTVTVNPSELVYPPADPVPFVATLVRDTNRGAVHVGQYNMPFRLLLKAKSCVPASLSPGM